jgi:hypothetical protein
MQLHAGKRGDTTGLTRNALERYLQSKYPGVPILSDLFPEVFSVRLRGIIPTFAVTPESETAYVQAVSRKYLRAGDPITLKQSSITMLRFCLDALGFRASGEYLLGVLQTFGINATESGGFSLTSSQAVFLRDLPWGHLSQIVGSSSPTSSDLTLESGYAEFLRMLSTPRELEGIIPFPLRRHFLFLLATGAIQSVIEGDDVLVDTKTLADWGRKHNIWSIRQLLTTARGNIPALRKFRDWTLRHPTLLRDATGQAFDLGEVFSSLPRDLQALPAPAKRLEKSNLPAALDSFTRFVDGAPEGVQEETEVQEEPPEVKTAESPRTEVQESPKVESMPPPSEFLFASRPPEVPIAAPNKSPEPSVSPEKPPEKPQELGEGWKRYKMVRAIHLSAEVTGGTAVPLQKGDTFDYSLHTRRLRAGTQVFSVGMGFLSRLIQEGHCQLESQVSDPSAGVKTRDVPVVPNSPTPTPSASVPIGTKPPIPAVRQDPSPLREVPSAALPTKRVETLPTKEVVLDLSDITGGDVGEVIALLTKGGWRVTFK